MNDARQHLHELIDHLPAARLDEAVEHLETMLDPVSRAIANAPFDDEPVSEEERLAVQEAEEWLKRNEPIPFEDVLADFGLTIEDVTNYRGPR